MTTSILSDLHDVETILKTDLLQTGGKPLLTFLQNFESNPSPSKATVIGWWIQFQGALLLALPSLESTVVEQLATWLVTKIQALLAQPA